MDPIRMQRLGLRSHTTHRVLQIEIHTTVVELVTSKGILNLLFHTSLEYKVYMGLIIKGTIPRYLLFAFILFFVSLDIQAILQFVSEDRCLETLKNILRRLNIYSTR